MIAVKKDLETRRRRPMALTAGALAVILILGAIATTLVVQAAKGPTLSWAPAPLNVGGLTVLASVSGKGEDAEVALHTAGGSVTFWGGVNMGSTVPGHNPGELATSHEEYVRWLQDMGDMNIRFLRIYTILPPDFYQVFADYNNAHPEKPIYLVQGVYMPDESYIETGNLYANEPTEAFTQESIDASKAVSGTLVREPKLGRASGTWTADVSKWLAGWIVGAELDPNALKESEALNYSQQSFEGTYFKTHTEDQKTDPVSSTEVWLAERMDELAAVEAEAGRSTPIAFVNWPTTDPLTHPTEPLESEDLIGIDANHILATPAWPGGTFASYHAYPYYPDFQRYTPEYAKTVIDGEPDAYIGYLLDLKAHHAQANLPTMITEFGVPSSIGSAHNGTNGRDQGAHSEQEAMAIDATLMRRIKDTGFAGALLFEWTDEWFKATWNTKPRQAAVDSERRALWHDPLTNEQWFGVIATDPIGSGWRTPFESEEEVRAISLDTDASFLHLKTAFNSDPEKVVAYGFDSHPGGLPLPAVPGYTPSADDPGTSDTAIFYDPNAGTLTAYTRTDLDPTQLDGLKPEDAVQSDFEPGWVLQRMTLNRSYVGQNGNPDRDTEFYEVGKMIKGTWNPEDDDYNSMATWNYDDYTLDMRIPWSMLAVADPTSHTGLIPVNGSAEPVIIDTIGLSIDLSDGRGLVRYADIAWEDWQQPKYAERFKAGIDPLIDAWEYAAQRT